MILVTEEQLREGAAELARTLINDGHEIEQISSHRWKVIARLTRGSEEKEKWFENFLDVDLYAVQHCKSCGRTFLVLKVRDNSGTLISYVVTDEEGDDVDPTIEPLCPAKSSGTP
jgi:hypothetical protein